MKKEVVISRYNEDVSWITNIDSDVKIHLYNKGEHLHNYRCISLPNVGRESNTYLYHICLNYNNLSDTIFFFQGYPFDHTGNCLPIINNGSEVWNKEKQLQYPGYWGYAHNFLGNMWPLVAAGQFNGTCSTSHLDGKPHHPGLPVGELWDLVFETPPPTTLEFVPGNQFNVNKALILNRSLAFWEFLLELSKTRDTFPWEFERVTPYIFHPDYKTLR